MNNFKQNQVFIKKFDSYKMKNQINNIINTEIKKFLNEGYVFEDENFKFRHKVNAYFYNYNTFSTDYDTDITESNIYINWHVGFWLNDFGIENFIITVDGVEGTYKLNLLDKQSDEITQETDKDISEFKWEFEIDDVALHKGKTLYIESLDFDFKYKKCRVNFYDTE